MVDYETIIPLRLKYLREKFSLSQEEIAKQLKIGQSTYANWEAGRRTPSIGKIAQLADIYETSVDLLLGRTDIDK
ncbi:helix-turn-helix domain-containing protein [Butyricicoccus faecihominis]|uniref:helix-turn-helix domain-containing protein n=1 Tax=Butyricicoccus faecihominis TaxID=1712515 RepID=UPI00247A492C|nr:helix-turn-helix transcriptional regulator [Butyricicoccus faecihominis]MCQ5129832.1 helix-turn-helix domain-containing protein [Butyricicoccus faecihominis]